MRSLRYLNTILTVLAVLMCAQLWTSWNTSSASLSMTHEAYAQGIPNAGAQRKEMIEALAKLNAQVAATHELLRSGQVRVQMDAPPANP